MRGFYMESSAHAEAGDSQSQWQATRRVENNHNARAAGVWTSLLDRAFGPHCAQPRAAAGACLYSRSPQVGGSVYQGRSLRPQF